MKPTGKHIYLAGGILLPLLLMVELLLLCSNSGITWQQALPAAFTDTVVFVIGVWSTILLVNSYPTKVYLYLYGLVGAVLVSSITTFAEWRTVRWWYQHGVKEIAFINWYSITLGVRFAFNCILFCWVATNAALRKSITELTARFTKQTENTLTAREAELFKLRQQLQPHFLYNSLNSINALIMFAPDRAQEMVGKLSDFLRTSVKRESEEKIKVREELEYIESYLAIESVRFGERLKVELNKDGAEEKLIPPFLLQPLLENAIKFGLYGNTGDVTISINLYMEGHTLVISIKNPYDKTSMPQRGTGFGLKGVGRRLYLLYARGDLLETLKDEQYFTTTLKIPQDV